MVEVCVDVTVLVTVEVTVEVTGGRLVVELVVVPEPLLQRVVPWEMVGRLPPMIISSGERLLVWEAPSMPHDVPYEVAVETDCHDPDWRTCRAGAKVTSGIEKMLVPCSSDIASTG